MHEFAKIIVSEGKTSTGGKSEPGFEFLDNFRKVEMLDREYSVPCLTFASRPELDESGRAFFVSGDHIDFLQESGEI